MLSWGLWLGVFCFTEIQSLFVANRELRAGGSRVKAKHKRLEIWLRLSLRLLERHWVFLYILLNDCYLIIWTSGREPFTLRSECSFAILLFCDHGGGKKRHPWVRAWATNDNLTDALLKLIVEIPLEVRLGIGRLIMIARHHSVSDWRDLRRGFLRAVD